MITVTTPVPLDEREPRNTGKSVAQSRVYYVVLTSVDKEGLPSGGDAHVGPTIHFIRQSCSDMVVECLTSDFRDDINAVGDLALLICM